MEKKAEKISFVFLIIGILLVLTAIPFIFIYDILGDPFTVEDPRANEHHEFMVMNGIAETKSEAVRMAVLKFGMDLGLLESRMILDSLRRRLQSDEITEDEIASGISEARS